MRRSRPDGCRVVLVTAPDPACARKLARLALGARAAACANLIPGVESHYWWKGKLCKGREVLLLLKTTRRALPGLRKLILASHPYETPEFVALDIASGSPAYLRWIADSLSAPAIPATP